MTVTEKLAHAAERKAFETMLDSLIRKSRTQDVGKVADDLVSMVQKIHSSVWEPETFAMLHKIANDPNSKWAHYAERLLRECDPYLLWTFLTAAAYEGGGVLGPVDRTHADAQFGETRLHLFFVIGVGERDGRVGNEDDFAHPVEKTPYLWQRIAQVFLAGIGRIRDQKQFHKVVVLNVLIKFLC